MRSNRSHLGLRHLALEPGGVRHSVVKGKGLGKVTIPGLHGCKECCEGCQLRRCCCRPGPAEFAGLTTNGALLHLCNHCDTLYEEMPLDPTRPCREAGTSRPCPSLWCLRSGAEEARGMSHGQNHTW